MIGVKFLRNVAVYATISILLLLISLYLGSVLNEKLFLSILAGSLLVIFNFLVGFFFIKFSLKKSDKLFLLMLWAGMALRLIFILILVFILLKFLELNTVGFIFSIFFFYVFYLIIEIFYLNLKKIERIDR